MGFRAEKVVAENGGIRMARPAWVALYIDDQSFVGGSRSPYPECNADHSIVIVICVPCGLVCY